jgi:hypothetical protein
VSGSGAVSGTSEKREERSGARSGKSGNGNGAVSGSPNKAYFLFNKKKLIWILVNFSIFMFNTIG